ncbi:MAG: ABC transporter substrate-binding protein [Pseudolabrys sp.]|nr:ABC transporter substrate-binding protein [Pseudolabrys sp.]MBV9261573.1 ABC transporter substrate-binding protein [Pseudolabrys sp.]
MLDKLLKYTIGAAVAAAFAASPALAQKVMIALPGVPPIYASVIALVAEKEGFYKKYGADVEQRNFDNGTAAARAVVAGDIDLAWGPVPGGIAQASNSGAPLVAIYGMPNPDWVLGTVESGKTCKDIAGQPIGVDAIGGARDIALRAMLTGCPDIKFDSLNRVALGSNTAPAMVAGQLKYGVLHLDDVAVLNAQGKKVESLLVMKTTNPNNLYLALLGRKDKVAAKRDAMVKVVAAHIDAARFMGDPKNADKVAADASDTGHSKEIAKEALKQFLAIDFWATKDDGLPKDKVNAVAALMKKIGSINADKEPVTYEQFVDPSIWKDAHAMVK